MSRSGICLPCNVTTLPDSELGANCAGGSRILAKKDWWRNVAEEVNATAGGDPIIPRFYSCSPDTCCNQTIGCRTEDACFEGRVGVLCSECEEGFYEWGQECIKCPGSTRWLLVFPCVAGMMTALYCLYAGPHFNPALLIFIHHAQTIPYIAGPNAPTSIFLEIFVWRLDYLSMTGKCPMLVSPIQYIMIQFVYCFAVIAYFFAMVGIAKAIHAKSIERPLAMEFSKVKVVDLRPAKRRPVDPHKDAFYHSGGSSAFEVFDALGTSTKTTPGLGPPIGSDAGSAAGSGGGGSYESGANSSGSSGSRSSAGYAEYSEQESLF